MKSSLALSSVLFAGSLLSLSAQDGGIEPADTDPAKPLILPHEEMTDEEAGEEVTAEEEGGEDPDVWFPGKPELPEVIYTMTGGEEPVDDEELHPWDPLPGEEIDPVIYQTGVPAAPKVSPKEKRANLQADIVEGCVVTYGAWDRDGNGALDLEEFSVRWPGPARSHPRAFKRIDTDRNGLITASEFSLKKSSLPVMPKAMGILEAATYRATFNSLDFDGNGVLTFGEFTAVLRPSGPGILEAIFAEADRNADGKISFAEYTHRPVNPAGVE